MPRKWVATVEDFPPLQPNRWYRVRVSAVEKERTHNAIAVDLEHLEPDQQGRTTSVQLPLPIRPAGAAAELFGAALGDQSVLAGGQIAPKDAVGAVVRASFVQTPDGQHWQPAGFRPAERE
jgi:hypothetical protein